MSDQATCRHCGKTQTEHPITHDGDEWCPFEAPRFTPGPTYAELQSALRSAEKREREALQVSRRMEDALERIAGCHCTINCIGHKTPPCVTCIARSALTPPPKTLTEKDPTP